MKEDYRKKVEYIASVLRDAGYKLFLICPAKEVVCGCFVKIRKLN